jgi:hypothetical protein
MINMFSRSKNIIWTMRRYDITVIVIDHHPGLVEAMQVVEDAELKIVMLGVVVKNEGAAFAPGIGALLQGSGRRIGRVVRRARRRLFPGLGYRRISPCLSYASLYSCSDVVLKRRSFVKCFLMILIPIQGYADTEHILAPVHKGN